MLTLQNLAILRGTKVLIESVNLSIFEKQRIGVVGSNGCGKTSLFSAILGQLEPSQGEINLTKNLRIASVSQEELATDISAINYTISGDKDLFSVFQALQKAEEKEDYETVSHCHLQLHEMNGYRAEAQAAKILHGLGFSQVEMQTPLAQFSGGWRMRLNLAKCLFAPSDLLLLDEPTNHLDMEAIIWLEEFLKNYPGAIFMVSHDQDFLDSTVTHIVHIENKRLKLYTGNYSSFEIQHAQEIAIQNAQYQKQQTKITHMMDFVNRFRAKASKAKQAQSRLRAVEKMELVQPMYARLPFQFHFSPPKHMPQHMLSMKKSDIGYDQKIVIKRADFSIRAGDRLGLLGVNGAGKSTFIKAICGELQPLSGIIDRAPNLNIGYFAQHQVDHLPLEMNAFSLLKELDKSKTEKELIQYLGGFGFKRDQSLAPLKQFSGGEKSRLALALIIFQKPNLLLLDEPTNHLDLEMRQALTLALQEFEGAILLVSHDRHLMRTLVDQLYLIQDHKLQAYEGSVEDYQAIYKIE